MPENTVTIVGNMTRDPELRFLNSGQPSTILSIAVNRRWQNRQTQEWEERVSFFSVVSYGTLAENVANSLPKGCRVIVTGRLEQRSWETETGERRSIIEINAEEISPSLRYATAKVEKNPRSEPGALVNNSSSRPPAHESNSYAFDEEPF